MPCSSDYFCGELEITAMTRDEFAEIADHM
jgi:hypothetical protein